MMVIDSSFVYTNYKFLDIIQFLIEVLTFFTVQFSVHVVYLYRWKVPSTLLFCQLESEHN